MSEQSYREVSASHTGLVCGEHLKLIFLQRIYMIGIIPIIAESMHEMFLHSVMGYELALVFAQVAILTFILVRHCLISLRLELGHC